MSDPVLGFDTQQTAERLRNERAARLAAWQWQRWCPPRQANASLGSVYDAHPQIRPLLESHLADWPYGAIVVLGPPGTGKTWLALAVLREQFNAGRKGAYFTMTEALDLMRPAGSQLEVGYFARVPLLILDDVGAERMTEWAHEQVDAIINGRWHDNRPMIVTSNATPEALAEHLGARSWSRLTGVDALVLKLTGPDRRKDRT